MYATYAEFMNMPPGEQCRVTWLDMVLDRPRMRQREINEMCKYERKWLVTFAKHVRLDDWYAAWDLVDSLPDSLTGKLVIW